MDKTGPGSTIIKSTCGICQIGCGILVHMDNGRAVRIEGDPENPLNEGALCPKGLASLEFLYHPDRLKHPLKRVGERGQGKWQQITWDEALDTIASELTRAKDKYGAESVVFIEGSNKGGSQFQHVARFANIFGSPNVTGQGHVCFLPRRNASLVTYGFYALPDYDHPPARIVLWGKNPSQTLYHVHLRAVKAVERGAKLMIINPMKIWGADKADLWLKPRPSSDLTLALGMINVIINEGIYDKTFVEQWTTGFDELKAHVQDYTPARVADITWVPAGVIKQAARLYATDKPACIQWGNGIDSGVNSFQNARALCILRAITGNLEIPGGEARWSLPPLTGHALGPAAPALTLPEKISPEMRQKGLNAKRKLLPLFPDATAADTIKAIQHGDPYPIRTACVLGSNALITYSNVQEAHQALLKLDFLAVADMFMTPTAALADIVLPVATYLEFDDIAAPPYSLPVALVQQKVTHVAECRSDYEILRDLARKLGLGEYYWDTEEQHLDFTLEPAGISFNEFRKIGALTGSKHYRSYKSQGFPTPSGKVELYSSQLKEWGFDPLPVYYEPPETPHSTPELTKEYPLVLTNWKHVCYRHSSGRQIASLRGSHPEPITYINPQTAAELGIADGDWMYIETKRGRIKQRATLSPDIDPRVIVAEYGWWFPEDDPAELYGWAKSNVNILTDDQPPFNREMGSVNLRGIVCKAYKASA